ncbi:MAG: hypothetical protein BWK79_06510 [Beggiatoa sp. IS2]|nr:MAG: hypothetical protein BWK79_06510 [Beggiatoa sp. IS2]
MKLIRKKKDGEEKPKITVTLPPWKILIVDDEPDIHALTRLNLRGFEFANKRLQFLQAMSAREARELLRSETDIAVALVDVVMETDDAGLKLVEFIRNELENYTIRLIIRTGQPGIAPERMVVDRYDIDDYKDKTELTAQKLYTTMRSALKAFRDLGTIDVNRRGLEKILDAASGLYQAQSIHHFFHGVLTQIIGLCNLGENGLISTVNNGLVVTASDERVIVQAGTGRFANLGESPEVQDIVKICSDSIMRGTPSDALSPDIVLIPLKVRDDPLGFIYLEGVKYLSKPDQSLLHVMTNQCASALENLRLYIDLKEANQQALYMLAVAAEYRDTDTGDHIQRVVQWTTRIAEALGLSKIEAESYGLASMLHDIGKIGIPDAVLQKPGKLTAEEFEIIKGHTQLGADILCKNKWFSLACRIALSHHEKWDGSGYPQGLRGEAIPLAARIVTVVDVFDALTHKRCYKDAWSTENAIAELQKGQGTHFDPKIVETFIGLYLANS